jgi:cysteinyl-tRNA synthetase
MPLTLYNSLTRRESPFEPLEPRKGADVLLRRYGIRYCHVGHARAYIVWDMVRRYLMWRGYDVRYVQNFTDIDDKILIAPAKPIPQWKPWRNASSMNISQIWTS